MVPLITLPPDYPSDPGERFKHIELEVNRGMYAS